MLYRDSIGVIFPDSLRTSSKKFMTPKPASSPPLKPRAHLCQACLPRPPEGSKNGAPQNDPHYCIGEARGLFGGSILLEGLGKRE